MTGPSPTGTPEPPLPLVSRLLRGGLWVLLSSYWMLGFGFAINIVLARLLAPEVFGSFALALFFAQVLRLQNKLGIAHAFIQRPGLSDEALSTFVLLELAAALAGLLLTLAAAPLLLWAGYSLQVVQVVLALAVAALFEGVGGTGNIILEKLLRFRQVSLMQSILFPLSYVPVLWLALRGAGVWSLAAQPLVYYVLQTGGALWLLRAAVLPGRLSLRGWRFDAALARHFVGFGGVVGLGLLATTLLTQLDNFYIGSFVGLGVLGLYDRAYRLAQWPGLLLSNVIKRTAFVAYARLQDDHARLRQAAELVLWLIGVVALPLALALFLTAPDLVRLLYGERWLPAAPFVRVLALFAVVQPVWENASQLCVALGKPRLPLRFMGVQAALLALAGLPLTLWGGAAGTCGAVALAFVVGLLLIGRALRHELSLHLGRALALPLLLALVLGAGYLPLAEAVGLHSLPLPWRVLLVGGYACGGCWGLLLLLRPRATVARLRVLWRVGRGQR